MKKRHPSIEDDFFSLARPSLHRKQKRKRSLPSHTLPGLLQSDQLQLSTHQSSQQPRLDMTSSIRLPSSDREIPPRRLSITPPPVVDLEAIRSQIDSRLREVKADFCPLSDEDENEEQIPTVDPLKMSTDALADSSHPDTETLDLSEKSNYRFNEDNESKRVYNLTLYSKLSVPANVDKTIPTIFALKGTKLFLRILEQSIKYFRSQYAQALSPPQLAEYDANHTALVWVEGKMVLKLFYRPLTLRVSPPDEFATHSIQDMPPTELTCILIPQDHAHDFTEVYPEFAKRSSTPTVPFPLLDANFEMPPMPPVEPQSSGPQPRPKADFFVIGLKGRDNKRVDVEVAAGTKLVSLIAHFAKVKGIDPSTLQNAKLIFDDEPMDLTECVGDTELEEDFEIQVVL